MLEIWRYLLFSRLQFAAVSDIAGPDINILSADCPIYLVITSDREYPIKTLFESSFLLLYDSTETLLCYITWKWRPVFAMPGVPAAL